MDSKELLRLINLLEKEAAARAADQIAFRLTISELNATIGRLQETIGNLLEENRLLKTPIKNSRNSSIPPSKDENRLKKTNSLRESSGKSPGGQDGHQGSTLKMISIPDIVIEHKSLFCNCCGLSLDGQECQLIARRQVIDIPPIQPVYTEHKVYRSVCLCGHQTNATFPVGVEAPISYGTGVEALIAYLHTRQYIPFARTSEFLASVCHMPISQGTVCAILNRFSKKAVPAYQLIKAAVKASKVIGADETGMNANGKLGWFWAWQSKAATFISYAATRGSGAIHANFPDGFPDAVLVHDCWKSHLNTPALAHQLCIAHLLRELLFFEQKYQSVWSSSFKKMLYQALELKKTIPDSAYDTAIKKRAEIELTLLQLLEKILPEQEIEVITFQKRIIKYRQHLFTFLYHPDVPPDNNASERAVRNVKIKQKVSGFFKSEKGAQIYATIRSITDTCIKNGKNSLDAFITIANLKPE